MWKDKMEDKRNKKEEKRGIGEKWSGTKRKMCGGINIKLCQGVCFTLTRVLIPSSMLGDRVLANTRAASLSKLLHLELSSVTGPREFTCGKW